MLISKQNSTSGLVSGNGGLQDNGINSQKPILKQNQKSLGR
jgi:hypothetical protein